MKAKNLIDSIEDNIIFPAAKFVFNFKIRYLVVFLVVAFIVANTFLPKESNSSGTNTIQPLVLYNKRFTVAATGDISCSPSQRRSAKSNECRDLDVLSVIERNKPSHIFLLGDLQYHSGTQQEFAESFMPTWGASKSTLVPALGNHEYYTKGASGFFSSFPQVPKTGYYSIEHKGIKFIVINTNCKIVRCSKGSEQYRWLRNELIRGYGKCTIVAGHSPRYSSGPHGNDSSIKDLWSLMERFNVFMYLSGHDHHYERFNTSPIQIVSGSGGKKLRSVQSQKESSEYLNSKDFGSLFLSFDDSKISSWFETVDGKKLDEKVYNCNPAGILYRP